MLSTDSAFCFSAALSSTGVSGTMVWAAESTAMMPISSIDDSRSTTCAVPRLARSIFCRPPGTVALMLPERSSATTMASASLRCSCRSSIDTGSSGSMADLK